MKILVTNVYSFKNKGDAAIVVALVREIERAFPKSTIELQTADIQNDGDKYGHPITSSLLWILLSSVRDKNILWRVYKPLLGFCSLGIAFITYKLFKKPAVLAGKELREFIRSNLQADLAIACGGGYLRTANGGMRENVLMFVTCLNILAPKFLGKRVYLYSQSIGPMHNAFQRTLLVYTLRKVDLIQPREDISMNLLTKLGITTPIVQTADPVLLLGGTGTFPKDVVSLDKNRLHVGITVRNWFGNKDRLEQYMRSVAQTIDYLIEKHNAEVFYIPQVIAENFGDDDRVVAEAVHSLVANKDRFTVLSADLHPFELIGICGSMDIFIGTRMHSNIFALISKVPVVAIEYEHKTRGIMKGLGLEDLTIDIHDVTAESLKERVDLLLRDRQKYKQLLVDNLPNQIRESRKAIDVIKQHYDSAA